MAILCLNVLSAFLENEHHLAEPEEMGLLMPLSSRLDRRKALLVGAKEGLPNRLPRVFGLLSI